MPNTAAASSRLYAQRRFDLCLRLLPQTLAAAGPAGTPRLAADPAFVWSAENWQAARSWLGLGLRLGLGLGLGFGSRVTLNSELAGRALRRAAQGESARQGQQLQQP